MVRGLAIGLGSRHGSQNSVVLHMGEYNQALTSSCLFFFLFLIVNSLCEEYAQQLFVWSLFLFAEVTGSPEN